MTYKVTITIEGLPDDEQEYCDELEKIEDAIKNLGYKFDTGMGQEE